jgi:hypothetical protein
MLQKSFTSFLERISNFVLECSGSRSFRFRGCGVVILGDILVVSTDFLSKFLGLSVTSLKRYLSNSEAGWIRAQLSRQEKAFFAPFLICLGNDWVQKVTF